MRSRLPPAAGGCQACCLAIRAAPLPHAPLRGAVTFCRTPPLPRRSCTFVQYNKHCAEDVHHIAYLPLFYCRHGDGPVLVALFFLAWMGVLFWVMSKAAEDFLVPALEVSPPLGQRGWPEQPAGGPATVPAVTQGRLRPKATRQVACSCAGSGSQEPCPGCLPAEQRRSSKRASPCSAVQRTSPPPPACFPAPVAVSGPADAHDP